MREVIRIKPPGSENGGEAPGGQPRKQNEVSTFKAYIYENEISTVLKRIARVRF